MPTTWTTSAWLKRRRICRRFWLPAMGSARVSQSFACRQCHEFAARRFISHGAAGGASKRQRGSHILDTGGRSPSSQPIPPNPSTSATHCHRSRRVTMILAHPMLKSVCAQSSVSTFNCWRHDQNVADEQPVLAATVRVAVTFPENPRPSGVGVGPGTGSLEDPRRRSFHNSASR